VPATSANLGPGFDSFGLALEFSDETSVTLLDDGLVVEVTGVGADSVPRTPEHLVVRAIARVLASASLPLPGLHLRCRNRIPHGGGLGSSAAAVVAGLLLGRGLLSRLAPGREVSDDQLLAWGSELEGHPDNVAPALHGGFTLCYWTPQGGVRAVRIPVHPDVRAVVFQAEAASSTAESRGALPATVPHADAAANAAAAGLLVRALTSDPSLLLPATRDRLHQDYRAPGMPETAALVAELRAAGTAAVVSGAGPSVLALVRHEEVDRQHLTAARAGFDIAERAICTGGAQLVVSSEATVPW
jgi:homoserine kinase